MPLGAAFAEILGEESQAFGGQGVAMRCVDAGFGKIADGPVLPLRELVGGELFAIDPDSGDDFALRDPIVLDGFENAAKRGLAGGDVVDFVVVE